MNHTAQIFSDNDYLYKINYKINNPTSVIKNEDYEQSEEKEELDK
jgi:hypothetical protein